MHKKTAAAIPSRWAIFKFQWFRTSHPAHQGLSGAIKIKKQNAGTSIILNATNTVNYILSGILLPFCLVL